MSLTKRAIKKFMGNAVAPKGRGFQTLNEAINFEKKCIFVAIPKTGTTSIRSQLKQPGIPLIKNPHLNIAQIRDSIYVYFLMQTLGKNQKFPSSSVPSDADLRARAEEVFNSFFKFSSVRNPWARAVSLYSRQEGVKTKDRISFENFCQNHIYASDTCRQPTLHKNQLDWMCDENGKYMLDYVYKLEDFEKAVDEIYDLTGGRVNLNVRVSNRNPESNSLTYRDLYTSNTKKIIAKRFEKDIDYFKYTF